MAESVRPPHATIPPEFRLPLVDPATVEQYDADTPNLETTVRELHATNDDLLLWIRRRATELFPDDLAMREQAVQLALGALSIAQNQVLKDNLVLQFDAFSSIDTGATQHETPPAA
ncbi:MAG TPA: hypothetical protein VN031_02865 [Candidatus Microsaccharimonas sp.]|nr:hypothetical protein [Candidatus Microsaccharimonas sp.]